MSDAEGHWEPIPDALYATTTARCEPCGSTGAPVEDPPSRGGARGKLRERR